MPIIMPTNAHLNGHFFAHKIPPWISETPLSFLQQREILNYGQYKSRYNTKHWEFSFIMHTDSAWWCCHYKHPSSWIPASSKQASIKLVTQNPPQKRPGAVGSYPQNFPKTLHQKINFHWLVFGTKDGRFIKHRMINAMHLHEYQGFKNQVHNWVHKSVLNRWQNEKRKHGFDVSGKVILQC